MLKLVGGPWPVPSKVRDTRIYGPDAQPEFEPDLGRGGRCDELQRPRGNVTRSVEMREVASSEANIWSDPI
jgi:hypothetical protein